jgi:hypothetical protein
MKIRDTPALQAIIKRAILEALSEQPFPLYTVPELAAMFHVTSNTILTWRKRCFIKAHCHVLSVRSWRWLFTHSEVIRFFEENFPSQDDLNCGPGSDCNPRTSKIVQMRKMLAFRRLYARGHSRRRKTE